jgi:hypothetical protein
MMARQEFVLVPPVFEHLALVRLPAVALLLLELVFAL